MITYLDKILYLFPEATGVSYWQTQYDGTPWEDPYDGLVLENPNFEIPRRTLDALDDAIVEKALEEMKKEAEKAARDSDLKGNLVILAGLRQERQKRPSLTLGEYLDELEGMGV